MSTNSHIEWTDQSDEWRSLNPTAIARVGKKAAGRLLDGREWNEFPKIESAVTA